MSKTISIDPPKGYKFQSVDQSTGAINLVEVPKDIMKQIQSFEDVCAITGKNPKDYVCNSDDQDDVAANALKMALLISKAYRTGCKEELDWDNGDQVKYFHIYQKTSAGWSLNFVGSLALGYALRLPPRIFRG